MSGSRRFTRARVLLLATAVALLAPRILHSRAATPAPPLPAPSGAVVRVSTEAQLQTAVQQIASNTTILIAPGTYQLSSTLYINKTVSNVAIRGGTDNRDDVVLQGPGMTRASFGNAPYGIWTGGGVQGVLIANLTIRGFYYHPIIFNAGTQSPRVYNVHLVDAGQQLLKSNPDGAGGGVNNGIVEYSVIEYSTTAPSAYTNGVDVHTGANWIIRDNLFRNIVAPPGGLAGPALLMWNHSSNTITERNLFVNCQRGIAYGLEVANNDHTGGVIRNNFVFRAIGQSGDVGISVADSPNTQVLNNTVYLSGTYSSPIEYRFTGSRNVVIGNNLLDGIISARDGATGTVAGNLEGATASLFANAGAGDLHLVRTATSAIDRGLNTPLVTDDWDGEARPQGAGYDIGADEFAASATTYQIGGRVVDGSGAAMASVSVALSGSRSQTTTTDATGAYTFSALAASGNYTVTPLKTGYSFRPADAFFAALAANQTAVNFVGTADATPTPTPTPTPSPSGAVAIDATAFRDQTNAAGRTLTTGAFSTAAGSELLLAFVAADDPTQSGITVTGVTGAGGTWQLVRRTNTQAGAAEIWRAFASAPLANATVSATLSAAAAGSVTVVTFTGVDTSGTNGSGAIGATASGSARSGAPTASLTTTRNNSWVFGVGNDFDNPIARTPAQGQTLVHQYMPSVGDTYWVQRTNVATPASGTPVTINDTAPTGDRYNLTICEILPAGGTSTPTPTPTPTTPPTIFLTAPTSGGTFTAPATIAVSANATAGSGATIAKVDFYSGANLLGTDTTSPYSMSYSNVAAGSYSLTAVATDSGGASTRSAPVSITVNPAPTSTPTPTPTPTGSGGLLQASNLVYEGAFRVPQGTIGSSMFAYGGTALAFNPARASLFAVGHVYDQDAAEITIPAIRNSSSVGALATANILQPFSDPTDGKLGLIGSGTAKVGGLLPYQGKLLVTGYLYYDASSSQVLSHFVSGMDLSVRSDTQGPYRVGSLGAGFVSGYMGLIPSAWQAALGGSVLTGQCCIPIVGRTSFGPSVSAMEPAQLGVVNPTPSSSLLYYTQDHPINAWNVTSAVWNGATEITGVVMPEGSRSVLFFGRHGIGAFCYGPGTSDSSLAGTLSDNGLDPWCYDPADSSKGTHAYPYVYMVWAYDANDLAAVKAGQKAAWDLRPYTTWQLSLPFSTAGDAVLNGAAYDPQTGRIFLSQAFGDGDYPVIHVFDLQFP